jgi:hypothetical protein
MSENVVIQPLETGIPGLDTILGGGFPEFSFNLLAGHQEAAKPRSHIRSCSQRQVPIDLHCFLQFWASPR